jgi:hypothetical protein
MRTLNSQMLTKPHRETFSWDVRTKHVTYENVPTLEHVRGIALYGPLATLFTLGLNNTVQQFDLHSSPLLVANVQHPVNILPPSPPVSIEEQKKLINVDMVSEIDEEHMFPLARIAREMDKLEERDRVPDRSGVLSPVSSQASPSGHYTIAQNNDLDASSSDFEEQPSSGSSPSVEIFKFFRVSMDDPCYKVLPAALKKYNIKESWEHYALYIVYGDQERYLQLNEKPLILFKQLHKKGKEPMFMLRKRTAHPGAAGAEIPSSADLDGSSQ